MSTAAESVALQALGFLASHENLLSVFMGATGIGQADLVANAGDPDMLAAVLDFVMTDDARVLSCARHLGIAPGDIARARAGLPGGDAPSWT